MDSKHSILRGPISKLTPFRIYKRFEEAVKTNASKDALIFEDDGVVRRHTYEELNNLANHLAKIIRKTVDSRKVHSTEEQHHIIGVYMSASDYLIITLLAIWKTGASYLPLDPNYPQDKIEYIIRDARPAMIVYEKDDKSFQSSLKLNISNLISTFTPSAKLDEKSCEEPPADDLAIVLYTSGSTGNPKGVCMSHTTLSNRLEWQFKNFPFSETENVCVFKTVITFVDSIFEIWAPLLQGRSVLILPQTTIRYPDKLVEALEKYQIERIILVPTLLETIILYKKITCNTNLLQNLKLWISSGEVLTENHVKQFYQTFSSENTKLCNFYGSTEITDVTSYVFTNSNDFYKYNCFPLGGAVDNTIIYVLDSDLQKCKEGEEGEIYISGLNLPLKYISSQNEAKLIDNPFETDVMFSKLYRIGDYGFMQDGFLFYKGRADTVVKIRGYRVNLLEVHKVVNLTAGVKKGVVLFHKDEILAFIQMHGGLITKQAIEMLLNTKLVQYMVPKVVIVSSIPLLVNGKTDRQLLLKNYEKERPNLKDFDTTDIPESQLEVAKILFQIISEFSSGQMNSKISLKSNFYEIGGNSLNSILTISKLMDRGYSISINDFVKASNLGEILNAICCSNNNESMTIEESTEYIREEIKECHKDDVIKIVTSSYYTKSSMDKLVQDQVKSEDYVLYINDVWPTIVDQKLSFVVKSKDDLIVGISLNCDGKKLFVCNPDYKLYLIESFYAFLEDPVFNKLYLKHEKIMYANLSATTLTLTPQENVKVMQYIEQEIIKVAKSDSYNGILTTNTSRITEQLGDMYQYETYAKFPVKDYVTKDGSKPFQNASDDFMVGCYFKEL